PVPRRLTGTHLVRHPHLSPSGGEIRSPLLRAAPAPEPRPGGGGGDPPRLWPGAGVWRRTARRAADGAGSTVRPSFSRPRFSPRYRKGARRRQPRAGPAARTYHRVAPEPAGVGLTASTAGTGMSHHPPRRRPRRQAGDVRALLDPGPGPRAVHG